MNCQKLKIHGKFQTLMALARKLDKTPRKFGTGHALSHSEIHMIEMIGDNENISVTDIGKLIGVTKGAISQGLKRLEKKGLTTKTTDPENLSRSIVYLTAKGNMVYWAHKHWHETMDGGFSRYLKSLDPNSTDIIIDFLTRMEDFLARRIESSE